MNISENTARVLIVDDERLNINILNDVLKEDYRVKIATNGVQALERAVSSPKPDVILLDIIMPGMDGFEVCQKLKLNPETADIPVIFITAKNSEPDEVRALELGGVDFISKPIRQEIVRVRIKNHVTRLRQQQQIQRMHHRLVSLSQTDSLTGIPNRRRFDEFLKQEWKRSQRSRSPLGLMMMDIDYFKLYNDYYGHVDGDECLKQVCEAIANQVRRPPDLFARYGGEEFSCILPDATLEGVRRVARNILEAVRKLRIPHAKSPVTDMVTISIGGTSVIPPEGIMQDQFIEQADAYLYQSKNEGRNRMTVKAGHLETVCHAN